MRTVPPRFRPLHVLSRGATADVLLAHDEELDRDVVVKLLAEHAASDPELSRRFRREARIAARLGAHPYVVTVHESGSWEGRPYIVLELLPGGSLADRAGPVSRENALRWVAQAASALDAAHSLGFVHRDVKPANLLVDEHGDLRLSDFGVARDLQEPITEAGLVLGTPGYLAPEQARGEATPATDRYALAALAYELLFGSRPDAGSTLSEGALAAVFERGLAAEPGRRFPTATAFVEALASAVDGSSEATRRRIVLPRTTRARFRAQGPPRWSRAERVIGLAAGLVTVVAAATLAGMLLGFHELEPSTLHVGGRAPAGTCTASPVDHDANVVVSGIGPDGLCRSLTSSLASRSDAWTYRTGRVLLAPDHGSGALSVVCRLHRGNLTVTVYDSGGQQIGRDICTERFAPSWNESSLA
jgi:serine/threonine protein kinase